MSSTTSLLAVRANEEDWPDLPASLKVVIARKSDPLTRAHYQLSDSGNARRWTDLFGDQFRYVPEIGWLGYDGRRWNSEHGEMMARQAARSVAEHMKDEIAAYTRASAAQLARAEAAASRFDVEDNAEEREQNIKKRIAKLHRHAERSGDLRAVVGMLKLAQADLLARLEDFDQDPLAFNVLNGTLRLIPDDEGPTMVRIDPHNPRDMITRLCPARFDPAAEAPLWLAHLARMQPDAEMRAYLHRIFGYCATGLQREQAFFVLHGRGGDGKSTTVNVVRRVMGEFGGVCDIRVFLENRFQSADAPSPALRRLACDIRLVSASEPPRDARLNEERMKAATGGAPLTARALNQGIIEFKVPWKIVMEVNWLPEIAGSDDGIWRRAHLVPWLVQLKANEMDRGLENRIVEQEAEGVLAWLIAGACAYLDYGLDPPRAALEAVGAWRESADPMSDWLNMHAIADKDAVTTQKELRDDYCGFCEANGITPKSDKAFSKELEHRGFAKLASKDSRTRRVQRQGIALIGSGALNASPYASANLASMPF